MALDKRERNLLIITLSLVVLGLNYLLVVPLRERWQVLTGKLRMQRQELRAVKDTIARKAGWQSSYEELGHNLKQSERFEKNSEVLKKIDEVSSSSGILMQSKRPLREEDHEGYRAWPVQCNFEATIESLVKFLYGLQTSSGFMTVEQLNVAAKPDNPSILRCDIQIRALATKAEKPAS